MKPTASIIGCMLLVGLWPQLGYGKKTVEQHLQDDFGSRVFTEAEHFTKASQADIETTKTFALEILKSAADTPRKINGSVVTYTAFNRKGQQIGRVAFWNRLGSGIEVTTKHGTMAADLFGENFLTITNCTLCRKGFAKLPKAVRQLVPRRSFLREEARRVVSMKRARTNRTE